MKKNPNPISPKNGSDTVLTSSFTKNHTAAKSEISATAMSRLRSESPPAMWLPVPRTSRKSSASPTSAPRRRAANGSHVWPRLTKSSFSKSSDETKDGRSHKRTAVALAAKKTNAPPIFGTPTSRVSCSLLKIGVSPPSSARFPARFFHILCLYKKLVSTGAKPMPSAKEIIPGNRVFTTLSIINHFFVRIVKLYQQDFSHLQTAHLL